MSDGGAQCNKYQHLVAQGGVVWHVANGTSKKVEVCGERSTGDGRRRKGKGKARAIVKGKAKRDVDDEGPVDKRLARQLWLHGEDSKDVSKYVRTARMRGDDNRRWHKYDEMCECVVCNASRNVRKVMAENSERLSVESEVKPELLD
jgi:hypothetical protein